MFSGRPSRRFSQRVFRAFSLSLLLVSAVFISFFLYIQRERMESELVDRGRMHAAFLAARIESATLSGAAAPLQAALDAAGELPEVRAAAVFTLEGTLVAVSAKDPMLEPVASARTSSETELFNSRRLLAGCVGLKQEGRFDVFCLLNTRDLMALARRVGTTTTAPIGVVRLSLDRGSMERDLGRMLLRSVPLAIAILMLGTGGAFFLSRRVTEPLEQLTEAVRAFGAGNAIREIPRTSDDEIGKLAAAFTNMIRDLSEREREKERLAERLRQAQSMEAVGTISQGISHDFKNILSTLKTAVHILQKGSPGNEFVMKYTGKMQTSLDRGRDLVERLVAFSPKRRIQVGVLDLNALFARLTPMLRLAAGEFVRLNVESPGVPVQVTGDAASLEQMMMNLAYNARDAMPEGGFLGMRLETMDGATDGEPGSARITVRDTGVGMSPEVRQRLFEPYFSTKDAGAGMGLGLSIVHNIVEQHHGRVEVESELGKGTIFRIELPLIAERDAGRQGGEGSA